PFRGDLVHRQPRASERELPPVVNMPGRLHLVAEQISSRDPRQATGDTPPVHLGAHYFPIVGAPAHLVAAIRRGHNVLAGVTLAGRVGQDLAEQAGQRAALVRFSGRDAHDWSREPTYSTPDTIPVCGEPMNVGAQPSAMKFAATSRSTCRSPRSGSLIQSA